MNTREQGDIGVAQAIYWYTLQGCKVSIPNTESTKYDLVIDKNGRLYRVQCKTTYRRSEYGVPLLTLTTSGGNRSGTGVVRRIDQAEVEFVWGCVEGKEAYELPSSVCHQRKELSLGKLYTQYRVI